MHTEKTISQRSTAPPSGSPVITLHTHHPHLVLAERVFLQQVLVAATHLEDVLSLIFLHTQAELLGRQVHTARLLPDGLGDQLLWHAVMRDLQRVLLLGVRGRYHNPNRNNQTSCTESDTEDSGF